MDIEKTLFTVELLDGRRITFNDEVGFFQASEICADEVWKTVMTLCLNGKTMVNIENVICVRLADDVEKRSYELFHKKDGEKPCT